MAHEIQVEDPLGGRHTVMALSSWTVYEIKKELADALRSNPDNQHLYVGFEKFFNEVRVSDVVLALAKCPEDAHMNFRGADHAKSFDDICRNPRAFNGKAPECVRSDRDAARRALTENGLALQFLGPKLQTDRDLVMIAVSSDGQALKHAKVQFRKDPEVVTAAVKNNGLALCHAGKACKAIRDVVFAAVRENGWALHWAEESMRGDREVVLEAVRRRGRSLAYAIDRLHSDREIVSEAVKQDGMALEMASTALRADEDIVLLAVRQNGDALKFADPDLTNNKHMLMVALRKSQAPWSVSWDKLVDWDLAHPDKFFIDHDDLKDVRLGTTWDCIPGNAR